MLVPALGLLGCGDDAPAALPLGQPPEAVLSGSTHLVEVVTTDHFGPRTANRAEGRAVSDSFEAGMEAWSHGLAPGAELAPGEGRDGSTAVAFGPRASGRSPYLHRQVAVSGHERCTVSVWVRTDGLVGQGHHAGARMEIHEMAPASSKGADGEPRLVRKQAYRHLTHLAGTVPWTLQQVQVDVDRRTSALEVRLTGGHDGGVYIGVRPRRSADSPVPVGTAYFDDFRVECAPPGFPDGPGSRVTGARDDGVVRRVAIDEDNRPAVIVDETSAWSVRVDRSQPLRLSTAVGLLDGTHRDARACFVVRVDDKVMGRRCRSGKKQDHRAWTPLRLDLPAQAGETSVVSFETRVRSQPGVQPTLAAWGDPSLRSSEPEHTRPPDILVVLVDTLRADSVNAADGRRPGASPALDALAAEGTLYSQARAPTSWTLPSSATLLTGMHPFRHGAGWRMRRGGRLSRPTTDIERRLHYSGVVDGTPRMAGLLREQGYLTRGWYSNHYLDPRFGLGEGFARWTSFKSSDIKGAGRAVDLVERALKAHPLGGPQPQLLFVHVIDPHLPYLARLPLDEGFVMPEGLRLDERTEDGRTAMVLESASAHGDPVDEVREIYDIDVHHLDEMVGRLVGLVDEDTLVVVTSDHGEAFMEHGEYQHGAMLYDEVLRIPLLVRWPGGEHAGTRVDQPVALADVTATVLDAAGVDPATLDGRPLPLPGAPPQHRPLVFSHVYTGPDRVSVLDWPYKRLVQLPTLGLDPLVRSSPHPSDLYDLSTDPLEQDDLSDRAPEVLAKLDALVEAQVSAQIPGTHLRCARPHPTLALRSEKPIVRGVPLSVGGVSVSADRRALTVVGAAEGTTRLVVEAAEAAEVSVEPAGACEVWRVAVPDMEVTLDRDQVENLRAIGYME